MPRALHVESWIQQVEPVKAVACERLRPFAVVARPVGDFECDLVRKSLKFVGEFSRSRLGRR